MKILAMILFVLCQSVYSFSVENAQYNVRATLTHYFQDPNTGENTEDIILQTRHSVDSSDWEPIVEMGGRKWRIRLIVYSSSKEIQRDQKASVSAILRYPGEMPAYHSEPTFTNVVIDTKLGQEVRQVWAFGAYDSYVLSFTIR